MQGKTGIAAALALAPIYIFLMAQQAQALPVVRGSIVATGIGTFSAPSYSSGQLGTQLEVQLNGTPWGVGGLWQSAFASGPSYFFFAPSDTTSVWGSAKLELDEDSDVSLLVGANKYTGPQPTSPTAHADQNYGPLVGVSYMHRWGFLRLRVTPTYVFYLQPTFTPWAFTTSGVPLADVGVRIGFAEFGLGLSFTPFRVGVDF